MVQRSALKGQTSEEQPVSVDSENVKQVRWGDMTIYEFPNLLGDNPAVSEGAPLTIGWKHSSMVVVAVEYHEYLRQNKPTRRRKDMIMSSASRDTFLLGMGYTLDQLLSAAEETRKIRKSRQANLKSIKTWNKFKQVFDGATRSLRRGSMMQEPKIVAAKCG